MTADVSIKVMQKKSVTSTRAPRNPSAQPGDRIGVTSRCLGNDHDISVAGSWRDVKLPFTTKKTYPLQTCYEHNMLSLFHAVCLKVLVFFMFKLIPDRISNDTDDIFVNQQNTNYPNYAKPTIPNIIKNSANIKNHNNTLCKSMSTNFKILHQNIRRLFHKTDEFLYSITLTSPHVLCLTEHHLWTEELEMINLTNYILGAQYCRHSYKQGGVSIFVSRDIQFHPIDLNTLIKRKT